MNIGDFLSAIGGYKMYADQMKERDARLQMDKDQLAAQIQAQEATVKYQQEIAGLRRDQFGLEQSAHRQEYGYDAPTGPQAWKMTLPGGRGVPGVPHATEMEHVEGFREREMKMAESKAQLEREKYKDAPQRELDVYEGMKGVDLKFGLKVAKQNEKIKDLVAKGEIDRAKELQEEQAALTFETITSAAALGKKLTDEDIANYQRLVDPAAWQKVQDTFAEIQARMEAQKEVKAAPSATTTHITKILGGTGGGGNGGGEGAVLPYTLSTGAQVDAATTEGQRAIRGDLQYMGADKDKLEEEILRLLLSAPAGTWQIAQYAIKKDLGAVRAKTLSDAMKRYGLTAGYAKDTEVDTIVNFSNNVFGTKVKATDVRKRLRPTKSEPKSQATGLMSFFNRQQ